MARVLVRRLEHYGEDTERPLHPTVQLDPNEQITIQNFANGQTRELHILHDVGSCVISSYNLAASGSGESPTDGGDPVILDDETAQYVADYMDAMSRQGHIIVEFH